MPITSSEIVVRLSGGSGNTNPIVSFGGAISTTAMGSNLFDPVASAEAVTGRTEYRCVYVQNTNSTLALSNVRLWLSSASSNGRATHAVGVGPAGVNGTEQNTGAETTAPSSVTFTAPLTATTGIDLGTIPAGQHRGVWIRRTVPPGAATGSEGFTFNVTGDSPP